MQDHHALLNCSRGKSGMFDVFTPEEELGATSTILTFTLERIKIQGCVGTWDKPGVINIANANINIKNSQFGSNGVVLHHPQIGGSPCGMVKLSIINSMFTACGFSKPYLSCIVVMGCETTNIHIQNTQFAYSGVQLQGDKNIIVNIAQTTFKGQNLRGPSLDIIFAPNQTQISLTDSVVSGHSNSKDSAVRIAIEQPTKFPSLHFTNVRFTSNTQTESLGGAVSLVSRFSASPMTMNIEFTRCTFTGNSAKDVGGAIYIEGLDTAKLNHCVFDGNTAVDGGAIFIINSQHITLYNSTFTDNQAMGIRHIQYKGIGGAIRMLKSQVVTTSCNFTNNTATFHGQAIHATDMRGAYVEDCIFTNASGLDSSPKAQLYLKQVHTDEGPRSRLDVLIKGNIYDSVNTSSHYGVFHVEVKGAMESDNNTVCCPMGQHVQHVSQPQHTQVGYEPGSSLDMAWCVACPMGTYNLQRDCLQLNHGNQYDRHQLAMCLTCPEYAKCTGAGRITALRNYWGSRTPQNLDNIQFQLCPAGLCAKPYCNDIQCCSNKRAGPLCGQCQTGHELNLATDACIPSEDCQYSFVFSVMYSIAFGAVYFVLISFFVVLTRLCLTPMVGSDPEHRPLDTSNTAPWDQTLSIQSSVREGEHAEEQQNYDFYRSEETHSQTDHERVQGTINFEPSLPSDFDRNLDIQDLITVQDDETQTSNQLSQAILMKTQSNLLVGHPFVLCVVWMLVQLMEELYQPWYDSQDSRYAVFNGILDVINLRPVYYMLEAPCVSGEGTSVAKISQSLVCILSIFTFLIVTSAVGNIILKVISKVRRSDMTQHQALLNLSMSQMFVTSLVLVYVPLLKGSFQLIHCVHLSMTNHMVLFINGGLRCGQWWQQLVTVIITISLAPVGIVIWMGLPLLKARQITSPQFMTGLVFPLPAAMYWVCRHTKSVCHCLFPNNSEVTQSTLYENHFQPADSMRSFFVNSFQIRQRSQLPQTEGRFAWIILIFLRGFVFITFSIMLSHWPVMKSLVLLTLLLLVITLHLQWQPYEQRSANRLEAWLLSFLTMLAVLGMNNSLVYTMGFEPYGYLKMMMHVNDWLFVTLMTVVLVSYVAVVVYYIIKASLNKRQ